MEFIMACAFLHTLLLVNVFGRTFEQSPGQALSTFYLSGTRRSAVECVDGCAKNNACKIASYVKETKSCFHGNDADEVVTANESVVYKPVPPVCSMGWTLVGGRCLKFVSTSATWYDGQTNCQSLGANMAHVYSLQDLEDVIQFIPCAPYECHPWLGLNDQEIEGVFRNPGGHTALADVVNLLDNNTPDEDCVYYDTGLLSIFTYDCSFMDASICEQAAYYI